MSDSSEFRPLKSEEDTAIDSMIKCFAGLHYPGDIAEALYKAGYRLPNA